MNCPDLRVLKLFEDAKLPERTNPTDSGADVFIYRFERYYFKENINFDNILNNDELIQAALLPQEKDEYDDKTINECCTIDLNPGERILVNTGLAATVGPGYEIQIRPRSGNALKKGLTVLNTPGTIDEAYRGMLGVIIVNLGLVSQQLNVGDKIAQIVVQPVVLSKIIEVESLDDTSRGASGFGDSDIPELDTLK